MIDKTKAYRFKGDSERWVYYTEYHALVNEVSGDAIAFAAAEHLHSRGILLEYPELPGDDWEFCEARDQEKWWREGPCMWASSVENSPVPGGIYCRKKKPVEPDWLEFEADQLPACVLNEFEDGWKPGDRVRVTRI